MQIKKILIALFVFVLAAVVAVYVFIPARLKVAETSIMRVNTEAAFRTLMDETNWHKWWPGPKVFTYNGQSYRLTRKMFNAFELKIFIKNDSITSMMQLISFSKDSAEFTWRCEIDGSNNPLKRFQQYRKARSIKENMDDLMSRIKAFMEKEENIYGFKVKKIKVSDSVLISTRSLFNHYPDEKEIDILIQQLRKYISSQHAVEKNYPMLNVNFNGLNTYEAMVAISVDTLLPAKNVFSPKLVLKGGNILEAEITGGPATIKRGFEQFENYRSDFRISAPAIPYQLLVTDRVKEPDTTKWITRFYYPVF